MNKALAAAVKAAHDLPTTPPDALSVREGERRWFILTIGGHRVEVTAGDNEGFGEWIESTQNKEGAWTSFNRSTFPVGQARELLTDFSEFAAAHPRKENL